MKIHPSTLLPPGDAARWLNENIATAPMEVLTQLCERVFAPSEADEFVAGLEARPLTELATGLLPHDPSIAAALRERVFADPDLGPTLAARLVGAGQVLSADETAGFDDEQLARIVDDAVDWASPFASGVEMCLSALAPERRRRLQLGAPVAVELRKLLDDPAAGTRTIDETLRERFAAELAGDSEEERARPIETVAAQVRDLSPHLQRRAIAVLRKLASEKKPRGSIETTLPERARLALRAVAETGPESE